MQLSSVDFPIPDSPMMATHSPAARRSETPLKSGGSPGAPKRLVS